LKESLKTNKAPYNRGYEDNNSRAKIQKPETTHERVNKRELATTTKPFQYKRHKDKECEAEL
jgi:hypothetical protein